MYYQHLFFSDDAMFDLDRKNLVIEDSELVIPKLAKKGFRMSMLANGPADLLRERFSQWAFAQHFEHLVISKEVGVAKPDRDFFEVAMRTCEVRNKDDVMIIGADLRNDIQAGIDYGIDTCWWNPGELETDEVELFNEMRCYEQLLDLV